MATLHAASPQAPKIPRRDARDLLTMERDESLRALRSLLSSADLYAVLLTDSRRENFHPILCELSSILVWVDEIFASFPPCGAQAIARSVRGLGDELCARSPQSPASVLRRCSGSLWDAVSTLKVAVDRSLADAMTLESGLVLNRLARALAELRNSR